MRYINADKIDFRIPFSLDSDGEILIPLSAARQAIAMTPTESVVDLDDARKAFTEYIQEMTVGKFGTPEECKIARMAVKNAVDFVFGGIKDEI